ALSPLGSLCNRRTWRASKAARLGHSLWFPSVAESRGVQTGGLFLACLFFLVLPLFLPGNVCWALGLNPARPGCAAAGEPAPCPPPHRPRRPRRPAGGGGGRQPSRRAGPGRDPPPRPRGRGEAGPGRAPRRAEAQWPAGSSGAGGGVGALRGDAGETRCVGSRPVRLTEPGLRIRTTERSSVRSVEMAKLTQLIDNEVFRAYATYTVIILLKMMLMSLITAYFRITRKAFVNPEDTAVFGKGESAKKNLRTDPDVERVRRGHLNDLENIVPFLGIGLLYALSGPELSTALLHFRIFAGARIVHTFAYLIPLPQPSRGLSWAVGYAVTILMAYKVLKTALYL
uniref:Microsomal glutathione S-transferase 1 n=3 Tax=Accipitrinae TaxID=8955 RepID=A0A663EAG0_AQUCH